jgi:hypothetical protein
VLYCTIEAALKVIHDTGIDQAVRQQNHKHYTDWLIRVKL